MSDYDRIAKAIEFINDHYSRQPALKEVARAAGLSEFHFQRLFRRWAGISPKRFLQFLTAEHARAMLDGSNDIFDAMHQTGLSSSGRLHDLFVNVYAATPAQVRQSGAGLEYATALPILRSDIVSSQGRSEAFADSVLLNATVKMKRSSICENAGRALSFVSTNEWRTTR